MRPMPRRSLPLPRHLPPRTESRRQPCCAGGPPTTSRARLQCSRRGPPTPTQAPRAPAGRRVAGVALAASRRLHSRGWVAEGATKSPGTGPSAGRVWGGLRPTFTKGLWSFFDCTPSLLQRKKGIRNQLSLCTVISVEVCHRRRHRRLSLLAHFGDSQSVSQSVYGVTL